MASVEFNLFFTLNSPHCLHSLRKLKENKRKFSARLTLTDYIPGFKSFLICIPLLDVLPFFLTSK